MRIGFLTATDVSAVNYRSVGPAEALRRQGYEVEFVAQQPDHSVDLAPLRRCDVVQVYRRADHVVRACVDDLRGRGIAVTWDNDDDIRLLPPRSLKKLGIDRMAAQRDFREQARIFPRVDLVTTTSQVLADRFREAGAPRVSLIENYVLDWQIMPPLRESRSFVIGWVAGEEHYADAEALGISKVLRRIMERNHNVRVVTIGARLDLDPARYEHESFVRAPELPDRTRRFDVGIAALGDIPMSYARSNVKVKEYAAAGVPWLASARGPYVGLGPREGGLLVEDDQWETALQDLIDSRFKRMRLRRRAKAWGKTQLVDRHTDRWLEVFEQAIEAAQARGSAEPRRRATAGR